MTEYQRPPTCSTCGKPLPCVLHDRKTREAILAPEEQPPGELERIFRWELEFPRAYEDQPLTLIPLPDGMVLIPDPLVVIDPTGKREPERVDLLVQERFVMHVPNGDVMTFVPFNGRTADFPQEAAGFRTRRSGSESVPVFPEFTERMDRSRVEVSPGITEYDRVSLIIPSAGGKELMVLVDRVTDKYASRQGEVRVDDRLRMVRFSLTTFQESAELEFKSNFSNFEVYDAFGLPDGSVLAVSDDGQLITVDIAEDGTAHATPLPGPSKGGRGWLTCIGKRQWLYSRGDVRYIVEYAGDVSVREMPGGALPNIDNKLMAPLPDGRVVAVHDRGSRLYLLDFREDPVAVTEFGTLEAGEAIGLGVLPDGKIVIESSWFPGSDDDIAVEIWGIPTEKLRAYHERQAATDSNDLPELPDV